MVAGGNHRLLYLHCSSRLGKKGRQERVTEREWVLWEQCIGQDKLPLECKLSILGFGMHVQCNRNIELKHHNNVNKQTHDLV